jgi:hypothetical protein
MKQIDDFIRNGATSAMLAKLFRLSSTDVTLRRRMLPGSHEKLRRPAMPAPAVRESIQKRWWDIRRGKACEPERPEDYEQLLAAFPGHTYATLWAVVHEFAEAPAPLRTPVVSRQGTRQPVGRI